METTRRIRFVLILVLLTTVAAQSAEGPAKISNTRTASCLVKITSDPAVLPLSFETIDYLLHSSGVGGKAAREVLNVSPDQIQGFIVIEYAHELISKAAPKSSMGGSYGSEEGIDEYEYAMMMEEAYATQMAPSMPGLPTPTTPSKGRSSSARTRRARPTPRAVTTSAFPADEQTYLFSLNIALPEEVKAAAEEFMDTLLFNLRNALGGASEEHVQRIKKQVELADEEAARAEKELSERQDKLRSISGSRILDRNRILTEIEALRNEIEKIEMEEASGRITVDATMKQIAEIKANTQEEIKKDTVLGELEGLLELQQRNLQNVEKLHKSGRASSANDLADAQEKLVRARIDLVQRQEQLSKSAGGNLLESLNSKLANYSLTSTHNKMTLERLVQQLAEAQDLLKKADEYELLSLKADIAKQNLQETILWRDRMTRQIRLIQPPDVSVIGGR